jgi:hypothetical protein
MSCSRWHHRGVGKYSFRPWAELAADVASGGLADLDAAVVEGVGVLSARPMSHSFPTWRGGRGRTIRPRFIHYIRPGRDHEPPSTNIPCSAGWKNASISSRNPQPQRPCAVIRHPALPDPCSRRAVPVRTGSLDRRGGDEYPVFGPGDGKKMLHGPVGTEASPCWLALGAGQVALPLLAAAMAAAIR